MNVLGSLFVELKANTAAFVEGMSAASYSAKRAGRDIEESFGRLGSIATTALAPFGEAGALIGEVFAHVGEWGAKAGEGIGRMAGGMNFLAVGAGAGLAAVAALDVAAIGLAISATEGAAKMLLLAQSAGVTVETFSSLAFAAKMVGIDQDTLAKSLEKFDKAMLKTATSAPGTATAFTRLHIAVKDADGQMRETQDVFGDVAEKFSKMQDGAVKTGLAIELFGRGGAVMIPLLNEGREGIEEFINTAKALGLVLDTETAEGAHKFRQDLETIEAAGRGISIRFMKELLPSIESFTHLLVEGLKDPNSGITKMIEGMSWLAKVTIAVAQTVWTGFQTIGLAIKAAAADVLIFGTQLGEIWDAVSSGRFGDIKKIFADAGNAQKANSAQFLADTKKIWKENSDFIENALGPRAPFTPSHKGGGSFEPDLKPAKEDTVLERIKERIAALQQEAKNWLAIGQAGTQAEQLILEATKKGDEEFGKLREQAAKSKTPDAMRFVMANEDAIRAAEATAVFGAAIKGLTSELDKQGNKFAEEASAAAALAAAYEKGGIASAVLDNTLADQAAKVRVLSDAHDLLAAKLGADNPEVQQLAEGVALANQELERNKKSLEALLGARLSVEIEKEAAAYAALRPFVLAVSDAHLQSAAAIRQANVELGVQTFIRQQLEKGIVATDAMIAKERSVLQGKSDDAHHNAVSEEAARFDLLLSYQEEMVKLGEVREALKQNGSSAILVDAAIYDANNRLIQQWDAAALKIGTMGQKFRATMNELALEGQNFSGKFFQAIGKAIDDLSTQFAKLVVTGKANFKEIFESLNESILKAGFQKIVGGIAGFVNKKFFGGAIPGLGPKADGSASSPFYVIPVDGSGGILGGIGGKGGGGDEGGLGGLLGPFGGDEGDGGDSGGGGGFLGGIFSKLGSGLSKIFSGLTGFLGKIAGGIGGAFSSIFSFFGGFLASGGDVTPGRAYIVGENHPEFFVPRQAGTVTPALEMGSSKNFTYNAHFHLHGVTDHDSFRRSKSQMYAEAQQHAMTAFHRTKG